MLSRLSFTRASAQLSKLARRSVNLDSEIRFTVIRTVRSMSRQRVSSRAILLPTRLLSSESAKPAAATDPAAGNQASEEKQRMIATQKYDEDGYADDTEASSHWVCEIGPLLDSRLTFCYRHRMLFSEPVLFSLDYWHIICGQDEWVLIVFSVQLSKLYESTTRFAKN
jgi:hypothetical protein